MPSDRRRSRRLPAILLLGLAAAGGIYLAVARASAHRAPPIPAHPARPAPSALDRGYLPVSTVPLPFGDVTALASMGDGQWVVAADRSLWAVSARSAESIHTFASRVSCLASRPAGPILYAGVGDHVEILTLRDGEVTSTSSSPSLGTDALLISLAPYRGGYCVADATTDTVFVFREDGLLAGTIGERTFLLPSPSLDLAPASDGEIWIAHAGRHRVERWSVGGVLLRSWGAYSASGDGFTGCCNPAHIAVLPDGGVVAAEKGSWRVRTFDAAGSPTETVVAEGALPPGTRIVDMAVDAVGRIGLLDSAGPAIRVFERSTRRGG